MLTALDAVVERIVARYAPERIIVFGSHVSGEAHERSDVDPLILKETNRRQVMTMLMAQKAAASGRSRLKASAWSASRIALLGKLPRRLRIARRGSVTKISIFMTDDFCRPAALPTADGWGTGKRWTPNSESVQIAGTHRRAVCKTTAPHRQPIV